MIFKEANRFTVHFFLLAIVGIFSVSNQLSQSVGTDYRLLTDWIHPRRHIVISSYHDDREQLVQNCYMAFLNVAL